MKIYGYMGKCNLCGIRVKTARKRIRISQDQLAARMQVEGIQVNQRAISRIETGERLVTDYELMYLAKVLNVDIMWLLGKDSD